MKRLVISALLVGALLTGCGSTSSDNVTTNETTYNTTTESTTETTETIETKTSAMPSDEEIIANAEEEVKPDTWFRSGNFYYYMQSDNTLAKSKMVTPSSEINTSRYVDRFGRWLRIDDFPELKPYFVELLKNKQATIPASVYEKLNLTQSDVAIILSLYKSAVLSSWITLDPYFNPNNITLTLSDKNNSVNNYDDYLKAMDKLKSLNLTTLDDIINYGLEHINTTDGHAAELPKLYPNLYGALYENGTVCDGFTHYIYWACKEQNIPVRIVSVTMQKEDGTVINHAFNQININGTWKYYDLTWEKNAKEYRGDNTNMFFDDIDKYYAHDAYGEDTGVKIIPDNNNIVIEYKD